MSKFELPQFYQKLLTKLEAIPLNGSVIEEITGEEPVLYSDLYKYRNIEALCINKYNGFILLYQRTAYTGHYMCLFLDSNRDLHVFDSYGIALDQELDYLSYWKESGQTIFLKDLVREYINRSRRQLFVNKIQYQPRGSWSNTCGSWALVRLKFNYLTDKQFSELFNYSNINKDFMVLLINLGDTYRAQIEQLL
jgi:hypothetical protein